MQRNIVITSDDCIREFLPDENKFSFRQKDSELKTFSTFPLDRTKSLLNCILPKGEKADEIISCYESKLYYKKTFKDSKGNVKYTIEVNVESPFLRQG